MTTYTAIANAEIDADSPITVDLVTKLRDNPVALAEQASGAPASIGNGVLLGTVTASGAASAAFTDVITSDSSNYSHLLLIGYDIVTANAEIRVQFGISGGTYRTSGYLSASTSGISAVPGTLTNASLRLCITQAYEAGSKTQAGGDIFGRVSTPAGSLTDIGGVYDTAESHTSVRILGASGNISGTFYLFGIPHTTYTLA